MDFSPDTTMPGIATMAEVLETVDWAVCMT